MRALHYDISPEITPSTAVFPGDTPYKRAVALDFAQGDHLRLSSMHSTVHLGAHADAPNHYHPAGASIEARPLDLYYGPCQVLRTPAPPRTRLQVEHLQGAVVQAPRVLLRTDSFTDPNAWHGDFNALSVELVDHLAAHGVRLVGIDTPSVDISDDPELVAHQAIYRHDMAILEGLLLQDVPDGVYQLTALPLRLRGADASPVRAVLWVQ